MIHIANRSMYNYSSKMMYNHFHDEYIYIDCVIIAMEFQMLSMFDI